MAIRRERGRPGLSTFAAAGTAVQAVPVPGRGPPGRVMGRGMPYPPRPGKGNVKRTAPDPGSCTRGKSAVAQQGPGFSCIETVTEDTTGQAMIRTIGKISLSHHDRCCAAIAAYREKTGAQWTIASQPPPDSPPPPRWSPIPAHLAARLPPNVRTAGQITEAGHQTGTVRENHGIPHSYHRAHRR
jgi:hypothetical protein